MKTVTLVIANNSFQASVLQDRLTNEGIEHFEKNEFISTVLPNTPGFQIEIAVYEKDYEKAREILKEAFPQLVE